MVKQTISNTDFSSGMNELVNGWFKRWRDRTGMTDADCERKLQEAWRDYGRKRKPKTYSATHPAYSGTALQAKHGGERHEER